LAVKPPRLRAVVDGEPGVGGESNVKFEPLVAVPPVRDTETAPVVPPPVTATICVAFTEVIDATAVPPIVTLAAVAPVKFVPLIVIVAPGQPFEGEKELMVGGGGGVKLYVLPEAIAAVVVVVNVVELARFVVETTDW